MSIENYNKRNNENNNKDSELNDIITVIKRNNENNNKDSKLNKFLAIITVILTISEIINIYLDNFYFILFIYFLISIIINLVLTICIYKSNKGSEKKQHIIFGIFGIVFILVIFFHINLFLKVFKGDLIENIKNTLISNSLVYLFIVLILFIFLLTIPNYRSIFDYILKEMESNKTVEKILNKFSEKPIKCEVYFFIFVLFLIINFVTLNAFYNAIDEYYNNKNIIRIENEIKTKINSILDELIDESGTEVQKNTS